MRRRQISWADDETDQLGGGGDRPVRRRRRQISLEEEETDQLGGR
jgi:hypothetical protein